MFDLTEEQRLIRDTARDFAQNELSKVAAEIDRSESVPDSIIKKLAEIGLWGILVPESYGGAGMNLFSLALALEEISRVCASTSVMLSVHNSLVCSAIIKYGTPAQKDRYLPRLASGEVIGAYALTEPNAGSDAAAIQTSAVLKGDKYLLNGSKIFLTNGLVAGLIAVVARTGSQSLGKGKNLSVFLVEPGLTGVKRGLKEDKMGVRGAAICEVSFEDTPVPAGQLLGTENDGFKIAMDALNSGRIGIAVQSVGIGQACLDASIKYARERVQFGKAIAEYQSIRWKLADMASEIEAARLLAYQAARLRDTGQAHTKEASMAKLFASAMCNKAAKDAVQIYGGMGYTKEFPVERYFRDAKVTEIYEGTSEVQRLVISKELLAK